MIAPLCYFLVPIHACVIAGAGLIGLEIVEAFKKRSGRRNIDITVGSARIVSKIVFHWSNLLQQYITKGDRKYLAYVNYDIIEPCDSIYE